MITRLRTALPAAARGPLLLAAALLVLSLGLPWTTSYTSAGYVTPGFCSTVYGPDGYGSVECSPGYFSPGASAPALPGSAIDVRVFVALTLLAVVAGLLRRSPLLVGVGVATAVACQLSHLGNQSGQLAHLAALVVGTTALLRAGACGDLGRRLLAGAGRLSPLRPPRRPPHGPRPASPPPGGAPGAPGR